MRRSDTIGFAALAFVLATLASADDWPQFRGPGRNGISAETGWIDTWEGGAPKVLWKARVGTGFSAVSVAKGRACTMGNDENKDTVFCFDAAKGRELWRHTYPADLGEKYFEGGTTGTPTIDGDHVFTLSRWGDAFCFDAATGKIVWSKNVQEETGLRIPDWGFAGSPVVHENLMLLNMGESGVALEKGTGMVVWKSADKNAGYSTPLLIQRDGKWIELLGSGKSYVAVEAKTGRITWQFPWATRYGVNAADPVVQGDSVFISSGYGKGAALLKLGAGEPSSVWQNKEMKCQFNGCVLVGGFLFGADGDDGSKAPLKCIDFATGAKKWEEKGFGCGGVMAADGRLIALGDRGELIIAKATAETFSPLARAQILSGKCWTVPVLANGLLYCRNAAGDVVCLDLRKNP